MEATGVSPHTPHMHVLMQHTVSSSSAPHEKNRSGKTNTIVSVICLSEIEKAKVEERFWRRKGWPLLSGIYRFRSRGLEQRIIEETNRDKTLHAKYRIKHQKGKILSSILCKPQRRYGTDASC